MPKPLKKRGAQLKFVGTAILFLSFITQNFFYESWRQSSDSLVSASHSRALIDKGALINEMAYYILSSADLSKVLPDQKAAAESKIQQFALKLYQSEVINIASLQSIPNEDKQKYINALHAKLGTVKDYRSAAEFTDFLNTQAEKYSHAYSDEIEMLASRRNFAKWAYLGLYGVGALLLLIGLYFDWKGADE